VLVVDDHPSNLLALESLLADLGCHVVTARSGEEALRCLLQQDFAVVLLDVYMPGLDGFETARLIRARERSKHLPLIFLSAIQKSEQDVVQAYSLGAVDFLFKPIVPEVLRAKVGVFRDLALKTWELQRQGELLRLAEQREHERRLSQARQRWEADAMREEVEKERRVAEVVTQRAAELARTVMERRRAEAALRESNARLELLEHCARRLLLEAHPERTLPELLRELASHFDLAVCFHHVLAENGRLRLAHASGIADELKRRLEDLSLGEGLTGRAALNRSRVLVELPRATAEQRDALRAFGVSAFVAYPLVSSERLLGSVSFGARGRGSFSPDELAVLQTMADQIAVVLDRARLISELEHRNRALALADRRKSEFLAMLGHELRNPLAPILYALQLMQHGGADSRMGERARGALERQVRHLVRLVDDLLDVSRIDNGRIELKRNVVPVVNVLRDALEQSKPLIEEREQQLEVTWAEEELHVRGDGTRLAQVVSNVLNNASKYTPRQGHIWLSCRRDVDHVQITVRDDGRGIEPEQLEAIFEPFVQTNPPVDRSTGGLGLGLSLVRKLVALHGGKVTAQSSGSDRGSEFSVRLPLVPAEQANGMPSGVVPRSTAEMRALNVIVVEDGDDVRETLCDLLTVLGHSVRAAADGEAGLALLLGSDADLAIVDIGLPGMDGYEVARRVREASGSRKRLVALTGYGQPEDKERALAAGFDAHLVKPIDASALERLLSIASDSTEPPRASERLINDHSQSA
jgi:signal transduction histidine kinase/DNA-binding response OmpR family regulator